MPDQDRTIKRPVERVPPQSALPPRPDVEPGTTRPADPDHYDKLRFAEPAIRLARPPSWKDLFDPRRPETFLSYCSAWSSVQMWFWPGLFTAENAILTDAVGLHGHERQWALMGLLAAGSKIGGLLCRLSKALSHLSDGLIASGLFMSVVFWLIISLSTIADLPHRITPVAMVGLALGAAWQLADWRRYPESKD